MGSENSGAAKIAAAKEKLIAKAAHLSAHGLSGEKEDVEKLM
jgi:hypothetical protein